MNSKPLYTHLPDDYAQHCRGAEARMIEFDGRRGLNFTGIRGRVGILEHTLNDPQGSLTLWVAALDNIDCAPPHSHHAKSNPAFDKIPFLSDREALHEVEVAHFALYYWTWWHPSLIAKWGRGSYLECCYSLDQRAAAAAGHFAFERRRWYQMTLTWDRSATRYLVYANGALIASSDSFAKNLLSDPCGPVLYMGNPLLALSDLEFYDQALSASEIRDCYNRTLTLSYPELATHLAQTYEGRNLKEFSWNRGTGWSPGLQLSLTDIAQTREFFVQGCGTATQITSEGLHIRTPNFEESARLGGVGSVNKFDTSKDMSRMYLWTHRKFEGDLHVSFEFKLNAHGGLALLMTQASGMQREDFMQDYAPRINGSMATVFGEDVRNYHWEYYREMCDVRNDLVSHGLMKNPWYRPLGFQMEPRQWELGRWYRLEWIQEGARLRGAIDGLQVLDVTDSPHDNNGPVFTGGHVALRCMMRTDIVLRNLLIEQRPDVAIKNI